MQKTISELRTFVDQLTRALNALVEGVVLVARDEVAELLSQYNELVPECDERLQSCAALLSRGLRDEALGYENDDPPLLESVTLLDLSSRPQWPQWLEALRALGFPQPAMPKVEIAVELREAQEQLATLKPLLDQWRRANLSSVPLAARIAVLRRLRKSDPNNEAWFECLRAHEKQRLMEIEPEAKAAFAARDELRLASLHDELKAGWVEPAPQRVVKAVEAALESIRGARIDSDIQQAADGLAAAFAARDLDAARGLRDRWNQLVSARGAFHEDDPHVSRATPVVEWLGRHDRLESLVIEVSQSVDAKPATFHGRTEWVRGLKRLRYEVEDLVERLEDDVEVEPIERLLKRAEKCETEHDEEVKRRWLIRVLSVAGAAVVVIAGIGTWRSFVGHAEGVRNAVAEINGLLSRMESGEIAPDAVPDLRLPDWLAEDPAVSARRGLLAAAVEREKERRGRFGESISRLEGVIDSLATAPKITSLDPWPESFVAATKLFAEITSAGVGKTESERATLTKAEGRLQNVAKRFQRDGDEVVRERIRDLASRLAKVDDLIQGKPDEAIKELDSIEKEAADLRDRASAPAAPGASGPFGDFQKASRGSLVPLAAGEEIGRRVATLKTSLDESARLAAAEKGITAALGDWTRYAERLDTAAADFSRRAIANDYTEAAKDVDLWKAIDAWNRFAGTVGSFATLSPDRAKVVAAEFTRARDTCGKLKFAADFLDRYEPAVKTLAERDTAGLSRDLTEWAGREWLGELEWMVTTDSDKPDLARIYYCRLKPKPDAGSLKYQHEMKVAGVWPDPKTYSRPPDAAPFAVAMSPQKALADGLEQNCVSRTADKADGLALDAVLIDAIERTIAAKQVEPCLRMLTLRKLLLKAREVSLVFQTPPITNLLAELDDGNGGIPGIEATELGQFLDPERDENVAYMKARRYSDRILARAPTVVAQVKKDLEQLHKTLDAPEASSLACVGRLGRDMSGAIAFVPTTAVELPPSSELVVVGPGGAAAPVGRCGPDGRAMISARSAIAGTPVFIWKRKGGK
jgi:hypothetical protein